jgi:hypothetical protein
MVIAIVGGGVGAAAPNTALTDASKVGAATPCSLLPPQAVSSTPSASPRLTCRQRLANSGTVRQDQRGMFVLPNQIAKYHCFDQNTPTSTIETPG